MTQALDYVNIFLKKWNESEPFLKFFLKKKQKIISNGGIDTEASYPYTATGPNQCKYSARHVGATVKSYVNINPGDENDLLNKATKGPVSVAIDASRGSFQFYSSGVYSDPKCSSTNLDHGVLLVGWGTDNGAPYWIVKNSWG